MQTNKKLLVWLIGMLIISLGLLSLYVYAGNEREEEGEEEALTLSEVPSAVRATIEKYAGNGEIEEIELEKEAGKIVYEVEVVKEGEKKEFKVSAEGTFLGYENEEEGEEEKEEVEEGEEEISFNALPPAVKQTAKKYFGVVSEAEVKKETEGGVTLYEIEVEKEDVEQSIEVTASGEIVESEKEVAVSSLPTEVLSAVKGKYPSARIKEASSVQKWYYEVEISVNGKRLEVSVSPTGKIMKSHEEERESKEAKSEKETEEDDDD